MDIENVLEEEILLEAEALKGIEIGSETYKTTVDGLTKLVDRKIEMDKIKTTASESNKQHRSETIHRWIGNGLTLVGILAPLAVTIWGTKTALTFEKEGIVSTFAGKAFINKLFSKGK